jgi:DUF1707 SHOCT-like domain
MAGRGDEIAAGAAGFGHLRASHADREQVIATLKAAFVQGMLDRDEFGQRVGQTFAARTHADLAAVTADLPAGLAAAQPPPPARAEGEQPVVRPGKMASGWRGRSGVPTSAIGRLGQAPSTGRPRSPAHRRSGPKPSPPSPAAGPRG